MTKRLENKVALVTAAAAGIGRSTALAFAAEGACVWATDIDKNGLLNIKKINSSIQIAELNVLDTDAVSALVEQIGTVDVLFNCAGFVHDGDILDCSEKDWDSAFDLNVKSCYRTIRVVLPGMQKRHSGSIINMSSVASNIKGVPRRFVYGATKAAVNGLTRAIAAEYVGSGIRCNAICPGTVDTPSLQDRLSVFPDPVAARKEFEDRQAMGRLGTADEIAALAVYLASDESAYTTGGEHVIDGGWTV